jgi:hypothetical protein
MTPLRDALAIIPQSLLHRDGYRCCAIRWLDQKKWVDKGRPANEGHAHLEAAHIIPFSFATWAGSQVYGMLNHWDNTIILLLAIPNLAFSQCNGTQSNIFYYVRRG